MVRPAAFCHISGMARSVGMKGSSLRLWEPRGAIWDGWAVGSEGGEFETVVGGGKRVNRRAGRGGLNSRLGSAVVPYEFFFAFLLPGGRPRLFVGVCLAAAIHAGGRPRLFPWPSAIRSRLMMASVI
jgi:hypothetical protein